MLAKTSETLSSPLSEVAMAGVLLIGAAAGWGLFKIMFSDKDNFGQSAAYSFTSGWRSMKRGELLKNFSGTFRFFLWLWLTIAATILGGILFARALSAIAA